MLYRRFFSYFIPVGCLLAGVLLVAGCQSEEIVHPLTGDDAVVTFNPLLDGQPVAEILPQTRVDDINFQTFGFTVCGYQSVKGVFELKKDEVKPEIFKGKTATGGCFQTVTYDVDKQKFMTLARPWVVAVEDYLSFFGWADNDNEPTSGIVGHSPDTEMGYPWIDVQLPDDISKQADVVTAQSVDLPNNALISAIDLQFRHVLSKISFKGYSSTGSAVKISKFEVKYGGSTLNKARFKFGTKSEFVFDQFSSKHGSGTSSIATSFPEVTSDHHSVKSAVLLGNMMQIPQDAPDGFITAKVTYRTKQMVNGNEITSPEVTREIPISGMNLQQGYHYILAFDFMIDKVDVSLNSIADWNEIGTERLPLVAGPRGDVMLWLDAGDAPYTFKGEEYWLDRSGYNRHCKIKKGDMNSATKIEYDNANKVYKFINKSSIKAGIITSYVELPALGRVGEITAQMLLMLSEHSIGKEFCSPLFYSQYPISLATAGTIPIYNIHNGTYRNFAIHLYERVSRLENNSEVPSDYGLIDFDTSDGNIQSYQRLMSDLFNTNQRSGYSFITARLKNGYKAISRNASHNLINTDGATVGNIPLNYGYLGGDFDGEIKSLKIVKRVISDEEMESDFAYVKKLHALKDDPVVPLGKLPGSAGETNGDKGLIAYFDAYDAPLVISQKQYPKDVVYWEDRSGNGNHLEIFGRTGRGNPSLSQSFSDKIIYDGTNKYYNFTGAEGGYMKLVKSLGALDEYLVVFGIVSNDGAATTVTSTTPRMLAHFTEDDNVTQESGKLVKGFASYAPTNKNELHVYANNATCGFGDGANIRTRYTWAIGRTKYNVLPGDAAGSNFYSNRGQPSYDDTPTVNIGTGVPNLKYCYIGSDAAKKLPFYGRIKTIRIYKRTVLPSELRSMYGNMLNGIAK